MTGHGKPVPRVPPSVVETGCHPRSLVLVTVGCRPTVFFGGIVFGFSGCFCFAVRRPAVCPDVCVSAAIEPANRGLGGLPNPGTGPAPAGNLGEGPFPLVAAATTRDTKVRNGRLITDRPHRRELQGGQRRKRA